MTTAHNPLVDRLRAAPFGKLPDGSDVDTTISVRLPVDLFLRLAAVIHFAAFRGVPTNRSDIVREALDAYLRQIEEAFPPESLDDLIEAEAEDLERAQAASDGPRRPLVEAKADLDARRAGRADDATVDKIITDAMADNAPLLRKLGDL